MSVTIRPYRKRGRTEWEVDIRIELPDGTEHRQRRKAPVSSKSGAKGWGEARERVLYEQLVKPPEPKAELKPETKEVPTLAEFAPRFTTQWTEAERLKPSGAADKDSRLRTHLLPLLGSRRLDQITAEDVQTIKQRLKHRSAKTTNNVLTVLSMMLKKAVEWDVIVKMPCTIARLPVRGKPKPRFHKFGEFEQLLQAAKDADWRAELAVLLGGEAGLRLGEMVPLEWDDCNFATRKIHVERAEWKGIVSTPKSGESRVVPMTQRVLTSLREHRHLRHRRVFVTNDGVPLTSKQVADYVRRAARKAGLRHRGVHALRHTFCSHLAMLGGAVRAIQEAAGHSSLKTTEIYMHAIQSVVDATVRLLDQPRAVFGEILEKAESENREAL